MNAEDTPSVDKLVKVYLRMKAALDKIKTDFEAEEKVLNNQMQAVKAALLDYCKDHNVESVRTTEGSFNRTIRRRYWANDWNAIGAFIVEHKVPELLEKRLHQGNTEQFIAEHPDLVLPGLNIDSEYSITVRKA